KWGVCRFWGVEGCPWGIGGGSGGGVGDCQPIGARLEARRPWRADLDSRCVGCTRLDLDHHSWAGQSAVCQRLLWRLPLAFDELLEVKDRAICAVVGCEDAGAQGVGEGDMNLRTAGVRRMGGGGGCRSGALGAWAGVEVEIGTAATCPRRRGDTTGSENQQHDWK